MSSFDQQKNRVKRPTCHPLDWLFGGGWQFGCRPVHRQHLLMVLSLHIQLVFSSPSSLWCPTLSACPRQSDTFDRWKTRKDSTSLTNWTIKSFSNFYFHFESFVADVEWSNRRKIVESKSSSSTRSRTQKMTTTTRAELPRHADRWATMFLLKTFAGDHRSLCSSVCPCWTWKFATMTLVVDSKYTWRMRSSDRLSCSRAVIHWTSTLFLVWLLADEWMLLMI